MPYADQVAGKRRYYVEVVMPRRASDPDYLEAQRARSRAHMAKKRAKPSWRCSTVARLAACHMRLHTLAPDGDLSALRERILKECQQWK